MTPTHKTLALAGFLLCGLTLPQASYGITGCTNANLMGVYYAQISSANFTSVLNTINGSSAPGTGTTGTTGTTTTTTPATTNPGGFGNNPNSLSGKVPGLGRYFLDGNGNIAGVAAGTSNTSGAANYTVIGKYSVNSDCSATMSLNTGETFNAVLAESGKRVLFIESDSTGGGSIGELDLATTACVSVGGPQTFAFSFFGAMPASAPTTSTVTGTTTTPIGTTGGTTTTTPAAGTFQPTAAVGSISLDGSGGFTLTEWAFASGAPTKATSTGTYTVGLNCSLQLTFNPSTTATTGALAGAQFQGLLVTDAGGLVVTQGSTPSVFTGQLIAQ